MIDKIKVARSFSRSAETYDSVAWFQQKIGLQLLAMMPAIANGDASLPCVDLGCGTGYFYSLLAQKYPQSPYLGIDIAEGMLQFLKQQQAIGSLLCADAECLPLQSASVGYLFSNMALQWCNNLPQLFSELYRVLSDDGTVGLTTLGPNTLFELKTAWAQVDDYVHVNDFVAFERWQKAIDDSGFEIECSLRREPVLQYESVPRLLHELKMLGAHNVNDGQSQALTGRKKIMALLQTYGAMKQENYYPVTYEVYFWVLRKK